MRRLLAAVTFCAVCLGGAPAVAGPGLAGQMSRDLVREVVRFNIRLASRTAPLLLTGLATGLFVSKARGAPRRSAEAPPAAPEGQGPRPAPSTLVVRQRKGRRFVKVSDIDAIRAADDYCELVLKSGERLLHDATLTALADDLPATFHRVHRSAIVNLQRVQTLRRRANSGHELVCLCGETLPVGRAYLSQTRLALAGRAPSG
ncbi:hypothetical protein BH11PSE2_BH11PSE2_20360 [soil metagenome]